jgi:hypothetical protein
MARNAVAYEEDFFAWTIEQARLLRAGNLSAIDAANIAEEIESVGHRDRRELGSWLLVLVMHLLKWSKQPGLRSRSWSATIREQRRQIEQILDESPSLGRLSMRRSSRSMTARAKVQSPRPGLAPPTSRRMPVRLRGNPVALVFARTLTAVCISRRNGAIASSGFPRAPPRARSGRMAARRHRHQSRNCAARLPARRRERPRHGCALPRSLAAEP